MKTTVINLGEVLPVLAEMFGFACADCECPNKIPAQVDMSGEEVDLSFFVQRIADKRGWKFEKTNGWLGSIAEVYPIAAFNIVLREIAVWLDQQYEDHIENSDKIFTISTLDGRIHEVCKAHIKNYRNFAAFRTLEDAKFACNILRTQLKGMFKRNAKK